MHTWPRAGTRRADRDFKFLFSSVGQENLRQVRAAAVEEADIADPLHDFAAGLPGQIIERRIARGAFADAGGDLDQFVIGEGSIQFLDHARGQAGISQHDERVQRMPQTAQMFLLFLGKHDRMIIVAVENAQAH